MPSIPRTQQYYPTVPLSELSDLYSKGDNRIGGNRVFIISYLPKTLRISSDQPFYNKYFLYIENTPNVTSIEWNSRFYLNNLVIPTPPSITIGSNNKPDYEILFEGNVVDNNTPTYDKLIITCTINNNLNLELEHSFIKSLDAGSLQIVDTSAEVPIAYAGDKTITNYIINNIKDFLSPESLSWNDIEIDNVTGGKETLLKIVLGVIYANMLNNENITSNINLFPDQWSYVNNELRDFINIDLQFDNNDCSNGICRIPVNILNDLLINVNVLPDFNDNTIYQNGFIPDMFQDNATIMFRGIESQRKAIESQQRLTHSTDKNKLVELFNLTFFPKASIKLAALLIKYLFCCSKANNCNGFYLRKETWTSISLGELKNNQDFLKNILSHYYYGPVNKLKGFSQDVRGTNHIIWSPAIYFILNLPPRITKAYFATKVVKTIFENQNNIHLFDFQRIDSVSTRVDGNGVALADQPDYDSILGKKVYLIVETLHCRNREVEIQIRTADVHLTGNDNDVLTLLSGRDDISINATNYVSDIRGAVGSYDHLRNNNDDDFEPKEKEYFKIDHKDKAVFKLRLRPNPTVTPPLQPTMNILANRLAANTANLSIRTKVIDFEYAICGNDNTTLKPEGEFLKNTDPYQIAQFRVINSNVFEITHEDNTWNFLPVTNGVRKRIGKISNQFIENIQNDTNDSPNKRVIFNYYDQLDNEYFVCESLMHNIDKIETRDAVPSAPSDAGNQLRTWNSQQYRDRGEDIWAYTLDFYQNGTLGYGKRVDGTTGYYWYPKIDPPISTPLMDADIKKSAMPSPPPLVINNFNFLALDYVTPGNTFSIKFFYQDTRRRFANPSVFAALIGGLAKFNQITNNRNVDVISEGFSFEDGSCFPSINHRNGEALDIHYFPNQVNPDIQRNIDFITSLNSYGFKVIIGNNSIFNAIANHFNHPVNTDIVVSRNANHNDHLHFQNFDETISVNLIV